MPPLLKDSVTKFVTRLVLGGLVATGVVAGGVRLAEYTGSGQVSPTLTFVARDFVNAYVTATGSATLKYPAVCVRNPLVGLTPSLGSGVVVRLTYENRTNPAAVGGDIGFTKGCGDAFGSGQSLVNDTCTATGCVSTYTTGTALWNGADYIKLTLKANPTSAYSARVRFEYADIYGE